MVTIFSSQTEKLDWALLLRRLPDTQNFLLVGHTSFSLIQSFILVHPLDTMMSHLKSSMYF